MDFCLAFRDTTEVTLNQDLTGVIEEDEDSDDEDSAVKGEITNEQAQLRKMLVNGYWRPKIDKIIPEALVNLMIGFVGNIPIYIDYFGDIEIKLTKNDLRYHKLTQKKDRNYEYIQYIASKNLFAKPFKTFKEKFQDEPSYPHQRRFCVMVDLRNEDTDSIYFYEPPANCRNIPTDPVPEWGISASTTSLLPNKEYDPWKAEHTPTNTVTGPNANVTVTSHCKGRLLTFSFQVIQKDEIRCYCYWNGQAFRFDPSDLKNVLFKIFDRDDEKNESFLEDGVDDLLNRMKENGYDLCDKSFWGFEKWCDGQTD